MKNLPNLYIYQTGHGKGIAKEEIRALAHPDALVDEVEDGFVVEGPIPNPTAQLNRMGGIVRITKVLTSGPASMPLNFEEWVTSFMAEEFKDYKGKIRFGLSMHPKADKTLKKILIFSKKNLTNTHGAERNAPSKKRNLRFVNKDFQNLSSVQAWHEKLLGPGAMELHLFKSSAQSPTAKWYLTRTLAIQDFEWYSKRDFDRPCRNAKNGMLPPKLAQILINLAEPTPDTIIFDPFCGSGTVLQEALLMGHHVVGSDLDPKLVEDTGANLTWLQKQREYDQTGNIVLFPADASQLTAKQLPKPPLAIVSEGTLGPPLSKMPDPKHLRLIQDEIMALYEDFFTNLGKILTEPTTLVFTAPYHRTSTERYFLENLPSLLARVARVIPLSTHERPSLFYERKEQVVGREIWKIILGK